MHVGIKAGQVQDGIQAAFSHDLFNGIHEEPGNAIRIVEAARSDQRSHISLAAADISIDVAKKNKRLDDTRQCLHRAGYIEQNQSQLGFFSR